MAWDMATNPCLATQQRHQCIGWKPTHSLPVRFKDLPAVPCLGLNDYLIGMFDLLGFLGFMNDLMGFHSDLGIETFLLMFYPDLDKAIDST